MDYLTFIGESLKRKEQNKGQKIAKRAKLAQKHLGPEEFSYETFFLEIAYSVIEPYGA